MSHVQYEPLVVSVGGVGSFGMLGVCYFLSHWGVWGVLFFLVCLFCGLLVRFGVMGTGGFNVHDWICESICDWLGVVLFWGRDEVWNWFKGGLLFWGVMRWLNGFKGLLGAFCCCNAPIVVRSTNHWHSFSIDVLFLRLN